MSVGNRGILLGGGVNIFFRCRNVHQDYLFRINWARGNLLRGNSLPRIIVLELIMRGNSAACYVEKPQLGASGVKMTPENLTEIHFQRGNF